MKKKMKMRTKGKILPGWKALRKSCKHRNLLNNTCNKITLACGQHPKCKPFSCPRKNEGE